MGTFSSGWIIFFAGLVGVLIFSIVNSMYHKRKGIQSFVFVEMPQGFVIKNNSKMNVFNSWAYFFGLSLLGFQIPFNVTPVPEPLQIAILYFICAALAYIEYRRKTKKAVVFDRLLMKIKIGNNEYSLLEYNQLDITNRRWFSDDSTGDSHGLYLKSSSKKYKLLWGYSIRQDLEALKSLIEKSVWKTSKPDSILE